MIKGIGLFLLVNVMACMGNTSKKASTDNKGTLPRSLVNTSHLDYLCTPVTFADGTEAAGVYIYAEAPDYHLTDAPGEGYTCVDDVSRAALVYLRSNRFSTDTSTRAKVFKLINFLLEMQSSNGYFYNFLLSGNQVNTNGKTSINDPEWWSWRALQTLTEGSPLVKATNEQLSAKMDQAVNKLVAALKGNMANLPQTTKRVAGLTIPQWLPAGSGTDQAALLILGLIPYCINRNDSVMTHYVKKLADGIVLMQHGDSTRYPYGAILSWENSWHAYGSDQAYALLRAGTFLHDPRYTSKGLHEVDNFYPWLLQTGLKSSFIVADNGGVIQQISENAFEQIAYGIRPMVFAAIEAYRLTGQQKYADIAGHLAAWFLGVNVQHREMYSFKTGRCYDALSSPSKLNANSGAESTVEALLTMQRVESYPAVKLALEKYMK
jgi:hypothetical protein